jgi:uncharacterized membrane protein
MEEAKLERLLFTYSMWWRIVYGVVRVAVGLFLFRVIDMPFSELLYRMTGNEGAEDQTDIIFQFLQTILEKHPFTVTHFVAIYVLFWGVVDIVCSVSLLKRKLWAFPVSMGIIVLFIIYEIYRFSHTHSLLLLWIIIVDIFIVWLIWREYLIARRHT